MNDYALRPGLLTAHSECLISAFGRCMIMDSRSNLDIPKAHSQPNVRFWFNLGDNSSLSYFGGLGQCQLIWSAVSADGPGLPCSV